MHLDPERPFFDIGDNTALVCIDQQPYQKLIAQQLADLNYKVHLGLFEEDVLLKLATYSYNVVVIAENFKGATLSDNPIVGEMVRRSGASRRDHFVVLLSQHFATNDAMSAFVQSVDQIINIGDIANFKPVLHRAVAEYLDLYRPFRETLKEIRAL
ncbi:MAG TPA: hypothetical protein VGI85_07545 [Chthoniobacterales bacterium]|jgi:hypothetical protein